MTVHNLPLKFRFKYVEDGYAKGFFSKIGILEHNRLTLDNKQIPLVQISDTTRRDNRLVILIEGENAYVLEVYQVKALELERAIDREASVEQIKLIQADYEQQGKKHLFHSVICPHCHAIINLSELKRTNYAYCRFCESIIDWEGTRIINNGETYRICDECGVFGHIKGYTEFYFYFLLLIYGYSSTRRHLCSTCASRLFWKMLAYNFIFIIGIVPSIYLKIRSMLGNDRRYTQLTKANALARKGRYIEANSIFRIMMSHGHHPGLLYNQALGHLNGDNVKGMFEYLDRSLDCCANYEPTLRLIHNVNEVSKQSNF